MSESLKAQRERVARDWCGHSPHDSTEDGMCRECRPFAADLRELQWEAMEAAFREAGWQGADEVMGTRIKAALDEVQS